MYVYTREGKKGIQTSDFRFIRHTPQSIKLPIRDILQLNFQHELTSNLFFPIIYYTKWTWTNFIFIHSIKSKLMKKYSTIN